MNVAKISDRPITKAEVLKIADFVQCPLLTVIWDLGNYNGTPSGLLTYLKAMTSDPHISRLPPEGLSKQLHKRTATLNHRGISITTGKSGTRFIILQKTVQTVPKLRAISPVAHEPQEQFAWFRYFCHYSDLSTAHQQWQTVHNSTAEQKLPLSWCYAYHHWAWHERKKQAIDVAQPPQTSQRGQELLKQKREQTKEELWQMQQRLMAKAQEMSAQPLPANWKIRDFTALIKTIIDIDRSLFGYEFRELQAIAELYQAGLLSEEQMARADHAFAQLKEHIRAIFSDPIH